MDDYISRKESIGLLTNYIHNMDRILGTGKLTMRDCKEAAESVLGEDALPSANIGGVLERNIDNIRQAGLEGKEFRFRIGGRLFAVRELPQ